MYSVPTKMDQIFVRRLWVRHEVKSYGSEFSRSECLCPVVEKSECQYTLETDLKESTEKNN